MSTLTSKHTHLCWGGNMLDSYLLHQRFQERVRIVLVLHRSRGVTQWRVRLKYDAYGD